MSVHVTRTDAVQGHIVAEEQFKLSEQHYLDQLPSAEEGTHDFKEANSSLHLDWQQDNGAETAVITGLTLVASCVTSAL